MPVVTERRWTVYCVYTEPDSDGVVAGQRDAAGRQRSTWSAAAVSIHTADQRRPRRTGTLS